MKNKNLLIVCPYFYPEIGGMQNYTYEVAKRLKNYGYKITVLCGCKDLPSGIEDLDGMKIIRQDPHFTISNTPVRFDLVLTICKLIYDNDIELVNGVTPVPFYAEMAALACKICRKPFVLTYHNDVVKSNRLLNVLAQSYDFFCGKIGRKFSNQIITSSPYCYNESPYLRPYSGKTNWIPPGVDTEVYSLGKSYEIYYHHKIPISTKVLLFVGQLTKTHQHKGVDVLISSFKMALEKRPEIHLMIVGAGDMLPEYQKLCNNLGISSKVTLTGSVNEKKLVEYYQGSDVVLLPSKSIAEGFGMVLVEGNSCGKPVIGSKIGGIKYVINDRETGLLVQPDDPFQLSAAIGTLLDDADFANKLGLKGREMVESQYNWEKIVGQTDEVYRMLLDGSS